MIGHQSNTVMPPKRAAMTPAAFKELLRRRRISQVEAAAILGVHHVTVCRWATGHTPISRKNAVYIRKIIE